VADVEAGAIAFSGVVMHDKSSLEVAAKATV